MNFEIFKNKEEQPIPEFEKVFAEVNTDLNYSYSELSGHDPEEGIWKFQLHETIDSNQAQNVIALNNEKAEGYAELLRTALDRDTEGEYHVTVHQTPSVHIEVERL